MEAQPKVQEIQDTQEEIFEDEPSLGQGRVRSPNKEKIPWWTGVHTKPLVKERPSWIEELEKEFLNYS